MYCTNSRKVREEMKTIMTYIDNNLDACMMIRSIPDGNLQVHNKRELPYQVVMHFVFTKTTPKGLLLQRAVPKSTQPTSPTFLPLAPITEIQGAERRTSLVTTAWIDILS